MGRASRITSILLICLVGVALSTISPVATGAKPNKKITAATSAKPANKTPVAGSAKLANKPPVAATTKPANKKPVAGAAKPKITVHKALTRKECTPLRKRFMAQCREKKSFNDGILNGDAKKKVLVKACRDTKIEWFNGCGQS